MRILRIDSWEGGIGGGQVYVRSVADELERRGHPQRILQLASAPPAAPAPDEVFLRTAPTVARRLPADLGIGDSFDRAFAQALREFDPDLVHLHRFDSMFTPIARRLSALEVPVVFTAHDAELVCPISTLIRPGGIVCEGGVRPRCQFTGCHVGLGNPYNLWQTRVMDRVLAPHVAAYLCPSSLLATYLHRHGYRPAVHLPPFAAIPDVVRVAAPAPRARDQPPRIGYLGRLEPYKGIGDLLEALPVLVRRWPDLRLTLAGEGSDRLRLETLARRLGVDSYLEWRGDLRGAEKEAWFEGIDLLVMPSNAWENFGLVALEALTRARPVVATNFGGIPDVVQDGETGRLVPVAAPSALAAAIGDVIEDPDRSRQWALEGRRRSLERFTPELHADRLLATYARVLKNSPIPSPTTADEFRAAPSPRAPGAA